MFCPYCGTETTQGLNFCNRCGGNLAPLTQAPAPESRVVVAGGAAWAAGLTTAAVAVIGLGLTFAITSELTAKGMMSGAVVAIALFGALVVVGCVAMLLRFWSMLLGGAARAQAPDPAALPQPKAQDTRGLDAPRRDSLNPAPAPSITEQTTRTLEHTPKKY